MFSPGQYLFYTSLIYFLVGMFNIFVFRFTESEVIQMVWLCVLCMPVFLPIGGIVRNAPLWRTK